MGELLRGHIRVYVLACESSHKRGLACSGLARVCEKFTSSAHAPRGKRGTKEVAMFAKLGATGRVHKELAVEGIIREWSVSVGKETYVWTLRER